MIVTGSEGFIGKALCRELAKRGVEVIGLDRKSGSEATKVCELLKNEDIDCVFHLAAQTSVFNGNLEQIRKDNIDTFMRVADACNLYHVKLVYASSSTANPENTTSMYGISKYFDEQYASIYCKAATGCRLHNVYGPNPRKRTLLWFLIEKENVSLYNCGQNIRCFTYIDDIVEGLIYAVGCNRQLINICNVQPVTTMYFASLVKYYKPLEIELINKKRDFDNLEQSVNQDIYLVPLSYTSVEDGVKKVFAMRREDNSQKNAGGLLSANRGWAWYMDEPMCVYRLGGAASWTTLMKQGDYEKKQQDYAEAMTAMYHGFDAFSGGRFHNTVEHAIRRLLFLTRVNTKRYETVLNKENREFYRELNARTRFFIRFETSAPKLYGWLQKRFHQK